VKRTPSGIKISPETLTLIKNEAEKQTLLRIENISFSRMLEIILVEFFENDTKISVVDCDRLYRKGKETTNVLRYVTFKPLIKKQLKEVANDNHCSLLKQRNAVGLRKRDDTRPFRSAKMAHVIEYAVEQYFKERTD
jgi:hypothetical protein